VFMAAANRPALALLCDRLRTQATTPPMSDSSSLERTGAGLFTDVVLQWDQRALRDRAGWPRVVVLPVDAFGKSTRWQRQHAAKGARFLFARRVYALHHAMPSLPVEAADAVASGRGDSQSQWAVVSPRAFLSSPPPHREPAAAP